MKENELIAGNWYKIKTTNKASYPGQEYFFKCKEDKIGNSLVHINQIHGIGISGDLRQSNGSFTGSDYILCDQVEVLWCEDCVRQNKCIPFDKNDYQTEPQFDLIF